MSKIFLDNMDAEQLALYTFTINSMLLDIYEGESYSDSIRNLCYTAIINSWSLDKKINVLNIVDNTIAS